MISWCAFVIWRTANAKSCTKKTISAFTSGDYTHDFYYLDIDGNKKNYMEVGPLGNAILQNCSFDIEKYDINWNSPFATVIINICYPDVLEVYQRKFAFSQEVIPSETIQDELISSIRNKEFKTQTVPVTLDIVQYNNKWYLLENEDLMNVYSGGLYNYYKQMITDSNKNKTETGGSK